MPSVADNLNAAIAGYAAQLAVDAATGPQPSYTLGDKTVSQNEWREGLQRMIEALQKTVNASSPYVVSTKMVL